MKIKICLIVILSQLSLLAQPAVAGMLDRKTPSEVAEAEGRRALTHERTLFQKAKDIREQLALFEIDKNPLIGIAATGFIAAIYIKGIGTATGFFLNGDTVYFETSMQALNRKLLWGVGASTFIGVVGLMLTKSKPARGGMVTDRFLESKEGMKIGRAHV